MIHSITLILDIGIVYIFFDQNFLPTKNFFDLKLFFDQKFLRPIFRPKFFSTKNVFGQKCFNQFFDQNFFFSTKFCFYQNCFLNKNCLSTKTFLRQIFRPTCSQFRFFFIYKASRICTKVQI